MFGRRDVAALGTVAVLVVLNQIVIQPTLLRLLVDAPMLNVAGRQRMLSQSLSKSVLALDATETAEARQRWKHEARDLLDRWSSSHARLRPVGTGGAALGLGATGPALRAEFAGLEPSFARLRAAAEHATNDLDSDPRARRAFLAEVLDAEADYLPRMDRVVTLYEQETRARVDRLIVTGWVLTALTLAALMAIRRYLLQPAERTIARQLRELVEAREVLEHRVRERTAELADANRDLQRQGLDRARAEERHRASLEQLSHVARTTTVGELASGLAHELNQPLGAIANYLEGSLVALIVEPPAVVEVRALDGWLCATHRAGAIVQRVRRFVTRHAPTREYTDPNRLAIEVEGFLRDVFARHALTVRLDLALGLPMIWCDPVQIQQVLVNLVRNAVEALIAAQPLDPQLVISTRKVDSVAVEYAVMDNGEGIAGERLERIFDAYFSTRDDGMGMGLAICRSIVEGHRGKIGGESIPGIQTTFRFTVPIDDGDADVGGDCDGDRPDINGPCRG